MATNPPPYNPESLRDAGRMLLYQPQEKAVLEILKEVASQLSTMEQLSAQEVESEFSPLPQALLTESILNLRAANVDIGVVLATCLCEIMRITAPVSLYADAQLEVAFKVIVSSFEDLNSISNRWFDMRIQNLETIANLRLGLVMLDIKCQEQIDELFDIFLVTISEDHPENVLYLMETIMVDTINSSEDDEEISTYMINSLLGSLQKNDREVHDISGNLAETVLQNCANKLKPHIRKSIESSGTSLDDYYDIVASVCGGIDSLSPMVQQSALSLGILSNFLNKKL